MGGCIDLAFLAAAKNAINISGKILISSASLSQGVCDQLYTSHKSYALSTTFDFIILCKVKELIKNTLHY